jgi:DNA-nicking Smr family endonuclease
MAGAPDAPAPPGDGNADIVELPIDGVLDLHTFQPSEARELVTDYLDECRDRDILEVRIIHGKGTGTLRRLVHAALDRRDDVVNYALAGDGSSWGATLVTLSPPD